MLILNFQKVPGSHLKEDEIYVANKKYRGYINAVRKF